jgi:hypothetical protein
MQQKQSLLLLFIYLFQNMSKFREWQETREEVSVEEFKKIDFDAVELFALEESPRKRFSFIAVGIGLCKIMTAQEVISGCLLSVMSIAILI